MSGCSEDEVVNGRISGPGWWANGRVYSRKSLFLVAEMHGMAWPGMASCRLTYCLRGRGCQVGDGVMVVMCSTVPVFLQTLDTARYSTRAGA